MPLLDLFWSMTWFFLYILWIWLVITILIDLFRSDDLSGWSKALWTLAIIFLPLLGVLAYLIARGGEMHRRLSRETLARQATADYYREM